MQLFCSKASKQLIDIMIRQQIRDCLGGKLPYQELDNDVSKSQVWKLANKTGWIPGTRHDVGIFYLNNKCFLASILSKDVDDLESKEVLADIGKYIFTYMKNS